MKKNSIAFAVGAMVLAGSASAQVMYSAPDGSVYYDPSCMMGAYPVQITNGVEYGYMGCPYLNGVQLEAAPMNNNSAAPATNAQDNQQARPNFKGGNKVKNGRGPSLAARLDMLDEFLQLNDPQQIAFGSYAQALLNAQQAKQTARAAMSSATSGDQRLSLQIQNLKSEISSLENISKLRQSFVATLTPEQIQKFELAETNPRMAMADAYQNASKLQSQKGQAAPAPKNSAPRAAQTGYTYGVDDGSQQVTPQVIYFVPYGDAE